MEFATKIQWIFFLLMAATVAGTGVWCFLAKKKKKDHLPALYLMTVLIWGILYSMIWIPFTAPDEYAHMATAYRLSNRILGVEAEDKEGYVYVREADADPLTDTLEAESYEYIFSHFRDRVTSPEETRMVSYPHGAMEVANHAYLPQALGITLGRVLSLGQIPTIYLARLGNLLFFVLCGFFAVKIAPFGKLVFLGVSMLPMTLELVSSLSYDGFALGTGMLFTAYVMNLIYRAPKVGIRQLTFLGILLACLGPCKMVYLPMALLCFLIPREKFGGTKEFIRGAVLVAAMMTAGVLLVNLDKMLIYFAQSGEAIDWAEENTGYSIGFVLTHPVRIGKMFLKTLAEKGPTYLSTMAGSTLGWLEYQMDSVITSFFLVWLLLTGLATEKPEKALIPLMGEDWVHMPVPHRWMGIGVCLCTLFLTLFFMLLSWTPLSSSVIEGVQGRYFLPILPLALLVVKNRKIRTTEGIQGILILGYGLGNLYGIAKLLEVIL